MRNLDTSSRVHAWNSLPQLWLPGRVDGRCHWAALCLAPSRKLVKLSIYTHIHIHIHMYIYIFTHTYIHTYTFRTWHTQGQHPSPEGSEQRAESASGDTWLDDIFFSPCIYSIMCLAILTWAHTWWKRGFLKWGISKSPWLSMLQWSSMTWMIWGTPI